MFFVGDALYLQQHKNMLFIAHLVYMSRKSLAKIEPTSRYSQHDPLGNLSSGLKPTVSLRFSKDEHNYWNVHLQKI